MSTSHHIGFPALRCLLIALALGIMATVHGADEVELRFSSPDFGNWRLNFLEGSDGSMCHGRAQSDAPIPLFQFRLSDKEADDLRAEVVRLRAVPAAHVSVGTRKMIRWAIVLRRNGEETAYDYRYAGPVEDAERQAWDEPTKTAIAAMRRMIARISGTMLAHRISIPWDGEFY